MQLTEHFTLEEMEHSETALRKGIENHCPDLLIPRLRLLCAQVLEPARTVLGPISLLSGYRCHELNEAVGGAESSQHMKGEAADIQPMRAALRPAFDWFRQSGNFDQLIWEFGRWIHVSWTNDHEPRRQVLEAKSVNGRTRYITFGQ